MFKKILLTSLIFTSLSAFTKSEHKEKMKSMNPEERAAYKAEKKAKWDERYDNASDEKKAKMDERKAKRMAKRAERNSE
jgi:hypothetical protein